jgi:hypothetical protein
MALAVRTEDATSVTYDAPTLKYVIFKESPALRVELTLKTGHPEIQTWQSFDSNVNSDMVTAGLLT